MPNSGTLWDWKYYTGQGFAENDEGGNLFFVYGHINILDIAKKTISKHIIRVYPSKSSENFPEENYHPFMLPKMTDKNTLNLTMPRGKETLVFPFDEAIVFKLP
ncbi:MAG: hypothetical protein LBU73_02310 [Helicobacteraceae bacterium]|nr:hypothetical protein [Helicobacteraceae bacterium]